MTVFSALFLFAACTVPDAEEDEGPFPDFGAIPAFSLVDQDNNVVTNATFTGKVLVVNFIFTSCPNICPKLSALMSSAAGRWQGEPDLHFVSFTVEYPEKQWSGAGLAFTDVAHFIGWPAAQ